MLMANGAAPMILTIILIHRISYIRPVRPERKKQVRTKNAILSDELRETLSLVISCSYCFERGKAYSDRITTYYIIVFFSVSSEFF
jgi:hypothetical protein